ncbi:MAG: LacI family transcriptional regulator [Spirochaetes bacterium]|nr:LacI family transcriptional regulator [Spirochaetota bacterium]
MTILKDVAKIAGVNISTVSRALRDSHLVNRELKEKIKKIAGKLNYVPDARAKSLATNIKNTIALVVPYRQFTGGEVYNEMIRGIYEKVEEELRIAIILTSFERDNHSFFRIIDENRLDGAIIIGDTYSDEDIKMISGILFPVILLHQKVDSPASNIVNIYSDNREGIRLMTEHLIKKRNRKNLLYVGGGERYKSNQERTAGFLKEVKREKIKYKVLNAAYERGAGSGYDLIQDLFQKGDFNYDGIVCSSDDLAIGIIRFLLEKDRGFYQKISITGYDNKANSSYIYPALTTVDHQPYQIGRASAEILLNWIYNKKKPVKKSYVFIPTLVIRESCGK